MKFSTESENLLKRFFTTPEHRERMLVEARDRENSVSKEILDAVGMEYSILMDACTVLDELAERTEEAKELNEEATRLCRGLLKDSSDGKAQDELKEIKGRIDSVQKEIYRIGEYVKGVEEAKRMLRKIERDVVSGASKAGSSVASYADPSAASQADPSDSAGADSAGARQADSTSDSAGDAATDHPPAPPTTLISPAPPTTSTPTTPTSLPYFHLTRILSALTNSIDAFKKYFFFGDFSETLFKLNGQFEREIISSLIRFIKKDWGKIGRSIKISREFKIFDEVMKEVEKECDEETREAIYSVKRIGRGEVVESINRVRGEEIRLVEIGSRADPSGARSSSSGASVKATSAARHSASASDSARADPSAASQADSSVSAGARQADSAGASQDKATGTARADNKGDDNTTNPHHDDVLAFYIGNLLLSHILSFLPVDSFHSHIFSNLLSYKNASPSLIAKLRLLANLLNISSTELDASIEKIVYAYYEKELEPKGLLKKEISTVILESYAFLLSINSYENEFDEIFLKKVDSSLLFILNKTGFKEFFNKAEQVESVVNELRTRNEAFSHFPFECLEESRRSAIRLADEQVEELVEFSRGATSEGVVKKILSLKEVKSEEFKRRVVERLEGGEVFSERSEEDRALFRDTARRNLHK